MLIQYPVIDVYSTGKNLRLLCAIRGISVRDLQKYCGFTNPQSVYRWFSGKVLPSVDNLYALSILLGVSMNDIIVSKDDDVVFLFVCFSEMRTPSSAGESKKALASSVERSEKKSTT